MIPSKRLDGSMHLSEDQVDEVLLDDASADVLAHLSGCELCQSRVQSFQSSMAVFNAATLSWAEAKSNTMPLVEPEARPVWNWAVASPIAAALVIGAVMAGTMQAHRGVLDRRGGTGEFGSVQMAAATGNVDPDPTQLAEDNAMLRAINTEMQPVESPLTSYGIAAARTTRRLTTSAKEVRN